MARPRPTPTDRYPTKTSSVQAETEEVLLKHLLGPTDPEPALARTTHVQFLARALLQGFPSRYVSQDASQPWLIFWIIQSFCVLQVGLDPGNKQRVIDTVLSWQHPDGGFGGGPQQAPHLLATYSAVCALAIAGRPGPGGGWDDIDSAKMYDFFMSVKQPDGSFTVAEHAEVDVRGIYCLLATATLLNILTPALVAGTAAFVASCQTYEGGFASSSQPYFSFSPGMPPTLLQYPRPALGEAHGGYTSCALAAWVMLQPFLPDPSASASASAASASEDTETPPPPPRPPAINRRALLRWLALMQGTEAELGGFRGRTNKLVDGCYSWWVGGAFGLLEAVGVREHPQQQPEGEAAPEQDGEREKDGDGEKSRADGWADVDDALFNREALQSYILLAGQHPAGGLRDKPPKNSDAYHTLYCLAGLSSAQHHVFPARARRAVLEAAWVPSSDDPALDAYRKEVFCAALCWSEEEGTSTYVGGEANRVNATHPVFNLTMTHSEGIMAHFYGQTIPPRPRPRPAGSSASSSTGAGAQASK